jgi:exopolysaccharide production negative regulator
MPIFDRKSLIAGAVFAVLVVGTGTPALTLDPETKFGDDTPPAQAYEIAVHAYQAGRTDEALSALEFAAGKGYAKAQWELARRYADGNGVKRDTLKAFRYFQILADQHAEDNPFVSTARIVADSFVELSHFYISGIPEAGVVKDLSQAFNLLYHAATYFGDAEAQYQLGLMYLKGEGRKPDPVTAAKWLNLAAKKNHVGAQGELGRLLYAERSEPREKLKGLIFLELARRRADPATQAWVIQTHDTIFATLDADQRQLIVAAADKWIEKYGKRR